MSVRTDAPASGSPASEAALRRDWTLFTLLTFLFAFGFAVYSGVFQNFLRDVVKSGPQQLGNLEACREIPGLLAAVMAGTLVALAESRVAGLGLMIAGAGIAATSWVPHFALLVMVTVFWSVGFHLWVTMQPAITLALSKGLEGGRHLGRMSAVGGGATLAGLGTAWAISQLLPKSVYSTCFYLAGATIFTAGLLCMPLSAHAEGTTRARLILRREYGLFYFLTFLEGCRRQIFSIFASFALVLIYGVNVNTMLVIQFVNSIMIALTAPAIGKLVDRRGERGPLTFYSIGLILVFLGYATYHNKYALIALFLIDNVLFTFGVGFTTYLNRIVRPGELTPCLAMGTTMNHIAAVTVPVAGAWLWVHYHNYQIPFRVGVFIALIALIANHWLPREAAWKSRAHPVVPETPPQEETATIITP